jgi:Flp pilus assembly protein TadB
VNGRSLTIHSMSFQGFADFVEQGADYTRFVRQMHSRLAAANPQATGVTGSSAVTFWGLLGCNVVIFAVLLLILLALVVSLSPLALVKLVIIAFYLPVLVLWFLKNKPASYPIAEPPAALLPK